MQFAWDTATNWMAWAAGVFVDRKCRMTMPSAAQLEGIRQLATTRSVTFWRTPCRALHTMWKLSQYSFHSRAKTFQGEQQTGQLQLDLTFVPGASGHASRMPFLMSGWQTPRHTCTLRQKFNTTFSATNNRRSASMAYGSQQSIAGHLHRWCSPQTEWSARSANDCWKRWLDEWWRRMETSVIQWWWTIFVRNWRCPSSDGISRVFVAAVHRTPGKSRACL